jgi:hypothetical protein
VPQERKKRRREEREGGRMGGWEGRREVSKRIAKNGKIERSYLLAKRIIVHFEG